MTPLKIKLEEIHQIQCLMLKDLLVENYQSWHKNCIIRYRKSFGNLINFPSRKLVTNNIFNEEGFDFELCGVLDGKIFNKIGTKIVEH